MRRIVRSLRVRIGRGAARELGVVALFVALSVAMTWPFVTQLSTHLPSVGLGDPQLYARFTHNVHEWLLGRRSGLFDFDFFFPHLLVGTTNDPGLAVAFLTFPLRLFTNDYLWLVNVATLASFPLTAHATYVLTCRLGGTRAAGVVAGVAFAFCFFRVAQIDHANVLQTAWMPYSLAAILRLRDDPSRRNQAIAAAALYVAGAGSHNLALYGALAYPPFLLFATLSARRGRRLRVATRLVLPCAIAAVALVPLYAPYVVARGAWLPTREHWEVVLYSGKLEGFFAAPPFSALYAERARFASLESPMFPGLVVLTLASVAVIGPGRATSRLRYFFFAIGAVYALVCLGPEIRYGDRMLARGVWDSLLALPGYAAVRTPARFYFVTCLALAVLAGCGAAQLRRWLRRRFAPLGVLLGPALVVLVLFELRVTPLPTHRVATQADAPAVYRELAARPEPGAVLDLPLVFSSEQRPRMLQSIVHGRPTVDGVSAFWLRYFYAQQDALLKTPLGEQAFRELHAAGLRYVVIHGGLVTPETRARYVSLISSVDGRHSGRYDADELFELPPGPPSVRFSPAVVSTSVASVAPDPAALGTNAAVDVTITSRTTDFVFERRVRRLTLELWRDGSEQRLAEVPVVLAPPLYAPRAAWVERKHFRVPTIERASPIRWTLRDERGELFGEGPFAFALP